MNKVNGTTWFVYKQPELINAWYTSMSIQLWHNRQISDKLCLINQFRKSQNAPVPYPTILNSAKTIYYPYDRQSICWRSNAAVQIYDHHYNQSIFYITSRISNYILYFHGMWLFVHVIKNRNLNYTHSWIKWIHQNPRWHLCAINGIN